MKRRKFWTVAFALLLTSDIAVSADADAAKEAFQKGKGCFDKGEFDAAIAFFTEAIRLKPDHAEAYCNRGWAYTRKHDLDKALADCSEAIRLDPTLVLAHSVRGWTYGAMGN
jgi:tetratricopeptide (TPR) repeat protein